MYLCIEISCISLSQDDRPATKLSYAQMAQKAREKVEKLAIEQKEKYDAQAKEQKKKDTSSAPSKPPPPR